MKREQLPKNIAVLLGNAQWEAETIGRSAAGVYRCALDGKVVWLKVQPAAAESRQERDMTAWLQDKLPVAKLLAEAEQDGMLYMVLSDLPGKMLCSKAHLTDAEATGRMLAEGLKMLWAVDITHCPTDMGPKAMLAAGLDHVIKGEVDMEDLDDDHTHFATAMDIYHALAANLPAVERPVLTHGDYCLPNVFGQAGKVSGFLDLGRTGVGDRWKDIALCERSFRYNFRRDPAAAQRGIGAFFEALDMAPDQERMAYYRLMDELF